MYITIYHHITLYNTVLQLSIIKRPYPRSFFIMISLFSECQRIDIIDMIDELLAEMLDRFGLFRFTFDRYS